MTLHRPANVDDAKASRTLLRAVGEAVRGVPVVFPVHPRTAKTLAALPDKPACLLLVDPQPYLEFNYLVRHARGVITDSGGVTEETTVMGVPCVTLRDTTERPETVTHRHQRADRHRPGGAEAGAGPPVRRAVEEGLDSREVGWAHRGADCARCWSGCWVHNDRRRV